MTIDPEILAQSHRYFLLEAPELLRVLEQELLNLQEGENNLNRIHTLLRTTHTLKGVAATVELDTIKQIAHAMEGIFTALCQPDIEIDAQVKALLFEGFECLRSPLIAELTGSHVNDAEVIERTSAIFAVLQDKLGDCFDREAPLPSSGDLGIDMVQVLFETEVGQIQAQFERLLEAQPIDLLPQLQVHLECLEGLAESTGLSGFKSIAQASLAALTAHPDRVQQIGLLALSDFELGRAAVLGGDRSQGGSPCPSLQQFAGWTETETFSCEANGWELEAIDSEQEAGSDRLALPSEVAGSDEALVEAIWGEDEWLEDAIDPVSLPVPPSPRLPSPSSQPAIVRINVDHLEQLNYLNAELLTNQNRQSLQDEKTRGVIRKLLNRLRQFQQILSNSQDSSDPLAQSTPQFLQEAMQLEADTDAIDQLSRQTTRLLEKQRKLLTNSRDVLLNARMLPLGEVLNRFYPILQQLQTLHKKAVRLSLEGTDVLVDKAVAERLYDPLLHLVRNAFDHGIESAELRQQQGKPPEGQIEVRAYYRGSQLVVEVGDDGQGINFDRIRQRAIDRQLLTSEAAHSLSEDQLIALLFESGFSTAQQLNDLSGRGVGLNVVQAQLQTIQGAVSIQTQAQQGTTFSLQIPLSLTMDKLLVCKAGTEVYALAVEAIEQILLPKAGQIQRSERGRVLHLGTTKLEQPMLTGELIPIYRLSEILDYPSRLTATQPIEALPQAPLPLLLLLCGRASVAEQNPARVATQYRQFVALEVDQILGEQEPVIRPFGKIIPMPDYIYGGSILADGRPTLVVNGATLVQRVLETGAEPNWIEAQHSQRSLDSAGSIRAGQILVIDDSPTQRQTLALTLQKAGYQVWQAQSGKVAIEQLKISAIDLMICDLEMPQMNGFEFLNVRRADSQLSKIPVLMLTSRNTEAHRRLAGQLGANAYLTKPYDEPQLLALVAAYLSRDRSPKPQTYSTP